MQEIEKNVPRPKLVRMRRYPWIEMEVGDSFLFPATVKHPYVIARGASRLYDRKFVVHKTDNGFRCWRVE